MIVLDRPVIENDRSSDLGARCDVRRLFVVWNRSYDQLAIIASSAGEALGLAVKNGHMKKAINYRRLRDVTDEPPVSDLEKPALEGALAAGRSGVAKVKDGIWLIDGEPV